MSDYPLPLLIDIGSDVVHIHDTSWKRTQASVCNEATSTDNNVVVSEGEFVDVTCADCLNSTMVRAATS